MALQNTKQRGDWAEERAVSFLEARGYEILVRNYRCSEGEIDIIALDSGTLAFVEVRARENDGYGHPLETIGPQKIRRIIRAAKHFLHDVGPLNKPTRFDAVGVVFGEEMTFTLVKEAFEA